MNPWSGEEGKTLAFGMPSEVYHGIDALGSSTLKRMATKSPWHAWKTGLDPARPVIPPSDAMRAGTLAHCALLEPERLIERYTVRPAWVDGRTTKGKAWLLDNRHFGCEFITEEQMDTALAQAEAVRKQLPEVADLLDANGASEVSAFWQREVIDAETGEGTMVDCKCRPDRVCESDASSVVLLDLKTAKNASEEGFARATANYRYELQDAWYLDGYEAASGLMVLAVVLVAVESEYPFAAAAYVLDDVAMAEAREDIEKLVRVYARCRATGVWPSYPSTVQPLSLPGWRRR